MTSERDISTRFHLWREDTLSAVMFLTRLPVSGAPPVMPRALRALPLAGAVVGLIGAIVLIGANSIGLAPLVAAILALAAMAYLTGALHEDGLADTADGFGGGHDVEQKLAIMRDSRLGSYGAMALILAVGLRAALLADVVTFASAASAAFIVIAAVAVGRLGAVITLGALPAARSDGLGESAGRPDIKIAISAGIAAGLLLLPVLFTAGFWATLTALLVAAIALAALCRLAMAQIGGQTGDVAGAAVLLVETGFLIGISAA